MKSSTVHLHSKIQVGPVDPRVFGGFLEHMGRATYVLPPLSVAALTFRTEG